jgi:hypothetical protein
MKSGKAMSINPSNPYNYRSVQPTQMVAVHNRNSSPMPTVTRPPAQTKKNEPSFSLPWALAGMATLATGAGLVFYAKHQIKALPETLEAIFRKTYTPEETKAMVKTYQGLLKIEDKKTFIEQAFQQIKKDKGLEDVNIPVEIIQKHKVYDKIIHFGHTELRKVCISGDVSKKKILGAIAHELDHVRQNTEMMRSGFYDHFVHDDEIRRLMKDDPDLDVNNPKHFQMASDIVKDYFSDIYGDVRNPSIQKDTPRYQKAKEYLKAHKSYVKNYDRTTRKSYLDNLLEAEAFPVGEAMEGFAEVIRYYKP